MHREQIRHVLATVPAETTVTVCGWVRTKRVSKAFAFIVINDGTSQDNLQIVVDENAAGFDSLPHCHTGSAIKVKGVVKESPGQGQRVEVHATEMTIMGESDGEKYPLQKKGHSLEFLREIGHLRPRTNTFGAVFRVRNALSYGVHQFFQSRGFKWVHTPIITASDCEGAGELFRVTTLDLNNVPKTDKGAVDFHKDFFGKEAHLTVSGQLQGEFLALALGDVYTFGPTFRAENSNTARHLAEFWMIEPEMAFCDLEGDAQVAEEFVSAMCKVVLKECPEEIAFLAKMFKGITVEEIEKLAEAKFGRVTYTEAVKELEGAKQAFEFPVKWGVDLQSEHERYLTEKVFKKPVIVTDYPKAIKAFYMRENDDGKTVAAMDVLVPRVGELIGGSQREERLDRLEARIAENNLPMAELQWYLDLRRYGSAPHAGFGLGFERLVQYLTGMANIRDVIPCPRAPHTVAF